jgi:hypothetical protein
MNIVDLLRVENYDHSSLLLSSGDVNRKSPLGWSGGVQNLEIATTLVAG